MVTVPAPAWDQFAVPRPYSRARAVAGPKVQIPAGTDRAGVESYRQRVEQLLNMLTALAEDWAASGRGLVGQQPAMRRGAGRHRRGQVEGRAGGWGPGDLRDGDRTLRALRLT